MQVRLTNIYDVALPGEMQPIKERHANFAQLLKEVDEIVEREKTRTFYELKQKRDEKEAEAAKERTEKRIEEILTEMAALKTKAISGGDSTATAQLSILSAELLRLTLFQ